MFCKHCGKRIDDDSTFCQYCGGRQGSTAAAKTATSAEDEFDGLDSFFSDAVSQKRAEEAKAAEMAKRFEIKDGVLVKYRAPDPPEPHVVVPDGVTAIGKFAFSGAGCDEITLPDSVTVIHEDAFYGCFMKKIHLSRNLTTIEGYAFFGCRFLTEFEFPDMITEIESGVLGSCTSLRSVVLPPNLAKIGSYAFGETALSSVVIPTKVTDIKDDAFNKCEELTSVTLPRNLKTMGQRAFSQTAITSLIIPDGVTEIDCSLCESCLSLERVELGRNTKIIYNRAFYNCPSLTTIHCGDALEKIIEDVFEIEEGTSAQPLTVFLPSTLKKMYSGIFGHRKGSFTVEYNGTFDQWKRIDNKYEWECPLSNVHFNGVPSEGDTYLFGTYTYRFHSEAKPIEWIVLSAGADRMLLFSKYILDFDVYHHDRSPVTWETSDLRRWLNDTFIGIAFSKTEQARILPTTVINENNPEHHTPGGKNTTDKLFCLSISEYQKLRKEYQRAPDHPGSTYFWDWWLRTPGAPDVCHSCSEPTPYVSFAREEGNVSDWRADGEKYGIRPAMWIKK